MCGIVGYSGSKNAAQVILSALSNLEYRGYDSAGMALWEGGSVRVIKAQGRLENLRRLAEQEEHPGACGIGHTRWATHGSPTDQNAHPHRQGRVTLVHNGIIENYAQLREELLGKGYTFQSQTDTEIAAALIDSCYAGDPAEAIRAALRRIEGAYAFVMLFDGRPGEVYGVRKSSPLIAAVDEDGGYLVSDLPAVLDHTRRYFLLEEGELAVLTGGAPRFFRLEDGSPLEKEEQLARWSVDAARKDGYDYFMLKEIHEQPRALEDTLQGRIRDGLPDLSAELPRGFFRDVTKLTITACGTALYAGMIGKAMIEREARIPVEVEVASELRYRNPIPTPGEAVIVISQSGETADTLAALRLYKERGVPVVAVVNVVGSTISREADYCVYTYAGPEIAVASTKAYSVQVGVMILLAILAAGEKGLPEAEQRRLCRGLLDTVALVPRALELAPRMEEYARTLTEVQSLFYIGRGLDYALAKEGSLKLKEISYIHSEAIPAGELKHGTISLVTPGTPVIALATQKELLPKTLSNIREVKARGGRVLLVTLEGLPADPEACDQVIRLPRVEDGLFAPLLVVIAIQLIAANAAILRGCDVDKPRNLAKSVTVE